MGCCEKKKPEQLLEKDLDPKNNEIIDRSSDSEFNENDSENLDNSDDLDSQALNVKVSYNDFIPIKLLGRGSFGEVILVRLKANNKVYAMKMLNKMVLKIKKQEFHIKTERDLMVKVHCPFIVNIKTAFQDTNKLYIVSEFMQGGDMFFHMYNGQNKVFNNEKTKFYIMELVLALECLHKQNMVYRDLKPENILIDSKGHLKITDFGLSKILDSDSEKAFTICGTPQYLAPEILKKKGYNKSVDWWSLGCVMYEMLTGKLPFPIKKGGKINLKIYENEVFYPNSINSTAKDLLQNLLVVNPNKRLGSGPDGSSNIKNHPFFKGANWDDIWHKRVRPPFIPKLKNDTDLKYFDNLFTEEPINGPTRKNTNRDRQRESINEYNGFSYVTGSVSQELMVFNKISDAIE